MKKTITYAINYLVVLAIGVYIGNFLLPNNEKIKAAPYKTITSKKSPDNKIIARVIFEEASKNYYLSIKLLNNTELLVMNKLISKEYHEPIIKISWSSPDLLSIEIDHDFGDNNVQYVFNTKELSLSEKL